MAGLGFSINNHDSPSNQYLNNDSGIGWPTNNTADDKEIKGGGGGGGGGSEIKIKIKQLG